MIQKYTLWYLQIGPEVENPLTTGETSYALLHRSRGLVSVGFY